MTLRPAIIFLDLTWSYLWHQVLTLAILEHKTIHVPLFEHATVFTVESVVSDDFWLLDEQVIEAFVLEVATTKTDDGVAQLNQ